jgi:hypothetical protein
VAPALRKNANFRIPPPVPLEATVAYDIDAVGIAQHDIVTAVSDVMTEAEPQFTRSLLADIKLRAIS